MTPPADLRAPRDDHPTDAATAGGASESVWSDGGESIVAFCDRVVASVGADDDGEGTVGEGSQLAASFAVGGSIVLDVEGQRAVVVEWMPGVRSPMEYRSISLALRSRSGRV